MYVLRLVGKWKRLSLCLEQALVCTPFFLAYSCLVRVFEIGLVSAVGVTMEGRDLLIEEDSGEDKEEGAVEIVIERAFVRGYRTDSGDPAWVKVDLLMAPW